MLPGQTGYPLGSLAGNSIPSSHRSMAVASVGPVSGVSRSRGVGGGKLSAANPGIPRFKALKRFISSFSFNSCVLLSGRGFEGNSLLCTINLFPFLLNPYYIKT